jgi:hypothetical protein
MTKKAIDFLSIANIYLIDSILGTENNGRERDIV